jgi:hypothetical protein
MLGLAAAWVAVSKIATAGLAEGITLVAAIYFVVRGIDNVYASIDEIKTQLEKALIEERLRLRPQVTFEEVKRALDNPSGPEAVRRRYSR